MALPAATDTFDTLVSSTLWMYAQRTAVDNITKGSVLLNKIRDKGRIKPFVGREIREPLEYALTPVYSIHYTEGVPLDFKEIITTARFTPKYMAAPLVVYNVELAMNKGEALIFDLLQAKVSNLERSFREKVNELLFLDGSGNGGKDIDGLALLIDDTTTVGNINPADITVWRSYKDTAAAAISFQQLSKAITQVTWDSSPDLIVMNIDLWQTLHDSLPASRRYDNDVTVASWGFANFLVRGNIPVVYDRYCPAGTVWVLNTNNISMRHLQGYFFQPTAAGFVYLPGADIKTQLWMFVGNMTISARRTHGKLTNKTA